MSHGRCPQSTEPDEGQDNLYTTGQGPDKSSNFYRLDECHMLTIMSHGGCPQSTEQDKSHDNLYTTGQGPEESSNFYKPDEGHMLTIHEPWGMSPVD